MLASSASTADDRDAAPFRDGAAASRDASPSNADFVIKCGPMQVTWYVLQRRSAAQFAGMVFWVWLGGFWAVLLGGSIVMVFRAISRHAPREKSFVGLLVTEGQGDRSPIDLSLDEKGFPL